LNSTQDIAISDIYNNSDNNENDNVDNCDLGGLCDVINNENQKEKEKEIKNEVHHATQIQHENGDDNVDNSNCSKNGNGSKNGIGPKNGNRNGNGKAHFDEIHQIDGIIILNGGTDENLTSTIQKSDATLREKDMDYNQEKSLEPDLDIPRMGPQAGGTELLFEFDPRSSFGPQGDADPGPSKSITISLTTSSQSQSPLPSPSLSLTPSTTTTSTINTTSSTTSSSFSAHYPSTTSLPSPTL
jgi:hypothetical protein